jgi:pimeloyl-ACP methyl ester carboxylesterase
MLNYFQEVSMENVPLHQTEVTIAGIRSPLIEGGNASAEEAVVFVHGNLGSSLDWQDLAAQVSTFARAVALDMPGYGRAEKPEHFDYSVYGYAQHLASACWRSSGRHPVSASHVRWMI